MSPAAVWPRSGTGKCWEGSVPGWAQPHGREPGQPQGQIPATTLGCPALVPWPMEQRWGSGRWHGVPGCPQDTHCCTPSCPLQPGGDRPWGTECPCAARRGSASTRSLCRWLYEGVSRQKAEELLLQPGNHSGSFLIRESQTRRGCYSLSVRRSERASWDSVTHYRIHRLENGWLYISPRLTFPSLHDLVDHYSEVGEGLCCPLREPCAMEGVRVAPVPAMPAVVKTPSLNWDKIDSSLLFSEATSPPEEDSPISLGLREAISSYLLLTETDPSEQDTKAKGAKSS
ncbi:src-like-adapter 2 isoform X2 [Grus americana]|uniref:src-like-adapter 2 isoform X2 n=1 Tax=Grus americana TaxID=9117 RepID=UPI002407A5B1|nr:src-like-adapter 2 isoform X2 [Grus americana]